MAKYFGSGRFPLVCLNPKCGKEFSETVSRLEADPNVTCPHCGVINKLDTKELRDAMRAMDQGLDGLRRQMRKFGKS